MRRRALWLDMVDKFFWGHVPDTGSIAAGTTVVVTDAQQVAVLGRCRFKV